MLPVLLNLDLGQRELIFVDDCSPDDSVEQLMRLKQEFSEEQGKLSSAAEKGLKIRIIRLAENAGQQAAVYCGLNNAEGNIILTMDDDLQHPPSYIPEFIEKSAGFDLSYALPVRDKRGQGLKTGSRMRDYFFRLILGCPSQITPGSFRIISRRAVDAVKDKTVSFVYVSALLFRSMPSLKVQNVFYENVGKEIDDSSGKPSSGINQSSRIGTAARVSLYLKLIFFYGFPLYRIHSGKRVYAIKEEI